MNHRDTVLQVAVVLVMAILADRAMSVMTLAIVNIQNQNNHDASQTGDLKWTILNRSHKEGILKLKLHRCYRVLGWKRIDLAVFRPANMTLVPLSLRKVDSELTSYPTIKDKRDTSRDSDVICAFVADDVFLFSRPFLGGLLAFIIRHSSKV